MPLINGSDKQGRFFKWGKTGTKYHYRARNVEAREEARVSAYRSAGVPLPPKLKRQRRRRAAK